MSVFIRNNFPDIFTSLLPAIDTIYLQARDFAETKAPWRQIFAWKTSDRQFENITGFSGFPTIGTVGEGAAIPTYTAAQLYDKKFTHTKYAGAWSVSEEMEDDDQYEFVASLARAFARSYRYTMEVNFSNVINNAQAASEASADGSNWAAAHTLYNGSSITNGVSSDLGLASLQTAYNNFATLTDDQGIRMKLSPKYIVYPPAMRWVVGEILRSESKPYTTDNDKNILAEDSAAGGLKEIMWAEITDTDSWALFADPKDVNGMGLRAYTRQPFTASTDFNVSNLTMVSVGRGRWSRGVVDWRQGYHSAGA